MNSCPEAICTHSLSTRLSRKLAVFTMLVLGALFTVTWGMVKDMLVERNAADLKARCELITDIVSHAARRRRGGGARAVAVGCANARQHAAGSLARRRQPALR